MKNLLLSLLLVVGTLSFAQTTYYTCATSGENTTNPDGTTGCVASTDWNTAGNTLIVLSGTAFELPNGTTIEGDMVIEQGATVTMTAAFASTLNISGSVTVNGILNLADVFDADINILAGGFLEVGTTGVVQISGGLGGGNFNLNAAGTAVLNGSITTVGAFAPSNITIDGNLTGTGTLEAGSGGSIDGIGTINGSSAPWTTPLDLGETGIFTWDGTAWSPGAPDGINAEAEFTGDYNASTDEAFVAGTLDINASVTVSLVGDRTDVSTVTNDGTLELIDEARIGTGTSLSGSGNVKLTRTISANSGYRRLGFPVSAGTFADVDATFNLVISGNPNQISVYFWDAATSSYAVPTASTPLAGTAFFVFPFNGSNRSIWAEVPNSSLNNADFNFALSYNNPGTDPNFVPGPTDGWNQFNNPFMDDMSSQAIVDALVAAGGDFQQSSISIWDGSQYKVWTPDVGANDPEAEFVRPFEAFFVRTASGNSGSFTVANAFRADGATSGNSVSFFKSQSADNLYVRLKVEGNNQTVRTYVSQNDNATRGFDDGDDVAFLPPLSTVPVFYSLDGSKKAMRVNKLGTVHKKTVKLAFTYPTNNTQFTISAEDMQLPNGTKAILIDKYANKRVRIDKKDYTFTHSTSAMEKRFRLKFKGSTAAYKTTPFVEEEDLALTWFEGNYLQVETEEALQNATVQVFNTAGQLLHNQKFAELNYAQFEIQQSGIYIVTIQTGSGEQWVTKILK